jgi:hypothetical protein
MPPAQLRIVLGTLPYKAGDVRLPGSEQAPEVHLNIREGRPRPPAGSCWSVMGQQLRAMRPHATLPPAQVWKVKGIA